MMKAYAKPNVSKVTFRVPRKLRIKARPAGNGKPLVKPESVGSSGRIAQALDPSGHMKNLARPRGMAAIFHYAIRINILHSASLMNPRIQAKACLPIIFLLLAGGGAMASSAAVDEAQYEAVRGLGALNGTALQCGRFDEVRRMKKAMVEALPKRRALGQVYENATNESFLRFAEQGSDCPGKADLKQRIDTAIGALRKAFSKQP
jgi:hypothetical protein